MSIYLSCSRITVSTIGIIPGMKTFLDQSKAHLAISLHSPFEEERKKIMPLRLKNWKEQRKVLLNNILL